MISKLGWPQEEEDQFVTRIGQSEKDSSSSREKLYKTTINI